MISNNYLFNNYLDLEIFILGDVKMIKIVFDFKEFK